jgi:hypothetical protein
MTKAGVEAHMAIVDTTMIQIAPIVPPEGIILDDRRCDERVRYAQFVLPPAETTEI